MKCEFVVVFGNERVLIVYWKWVEKEMCDICEIICELDCSGEIYILLEIFNCYCFLFFEFGFLYYMKKEMEMFWENG